MYAGERRRIWIHTLIGQDTLRMKKDDDEIIPHDRSEIPKLRKEIPRFLVVGGIAVFIDAVVYHLILEFGFLSPSSAKKTSFITGAIWAYFANKYITFSQKQFRTSEPFKYTIVYFFGFLLNSVVHDVTYSFVSYPIFPFLLATVTSTIWNFIGQKWFVFR